MDDDETQQFSLRWHNHQNSVICALGRMLSTGALTDVTLSAGGTSVKAHRLVLASCSQYFAQLFKEVEADNTLVVVLACDVTELRLLLTFMYTGEVTASRKILPSLLRLAQTLKVSGLTDADTNSTLNPSEPDPPHEESNSPINLELNKNEAQTVKPFFNDNSNGSSKQDDITSPIETKDTYFVGEYAERSERDRLSKLDQIVQNLYSTHKIGSLGEGVPVPPPMPTLEAEPYDRHYRVNNSVCTICNKRLSNQYNLRVHMETHAGRRHACRACPHVSRSRDALRKHVAYRHARHGATNLNSVYTTLSNQYNLRVYMKTHAGRRHACRACPHVSRSRDALRKHVAYRHARHGANNT